MNEYCLNCMEPIDEAGVCVRCGTNGRHVARIAHHLPAGTVLANGRYLVGRALGQGGFGITYIGRDLMLNMRVAIKEYFPTLFVSRTSEAAHAVTALSPQAQKRLEAGRKRFLNEARVLAKFHESSGIVDVRDFFEQNETAYIVMDYLEGETLKDYLQRETIEADRAFALMQPILDTLELIHSNHVIHRDISPDNIMLCSNGNPCLMDFGAAHELEFGDQRTVSMVLKSGYAPEEQYRARGELGPWTDIYALCATIYRAITGVSPDESLQRLIGDEMVWPSEMGIDISSAQEHVLKKGMAPRRSDRYQSIADMKKDLSATCATSLLNHVPDMPESSAGHETSFGNGPDTQRDSAPFGSIPTSESEPEPTSEPERTWELEPTSERELTMTMESEPISGPALTPSSKPAAATTEPMPAAEPEPATESEPSPEPEPTPHQPQEHEPSTTEPQPKKEPPKKRHGKLIAALAAIAIVCIAAGAAAYHMLSPAYTVSFDVAEGSTIEPVTVNRSQTVEEPEPPTRKNYEFVGWYLDDARKNEATFPLDVDTDTTLHAAWKKVLASYKVKYLDAANENELAKPKTVEEAKVGSKVIEEALDIDGYAVEGKHKVSFKVTKNDSKNVITFKYLKLVSYEVRYLDKASQADVSPSKTVDGIAEKTQVNEAALEIDGYKLQSENEQSLTLARDSGKNVIVFYYELIPIVVEPVYEPYYDDGGSWGGGSSGGGSSGGGGHSSGGGSSGGSNDVVWAN